MTFHTCPECDANFKSSDMKNGHLPPHTFKGKPCTIGPDLDIDGREFFRISANTDKGRAFMRQVEGVENGVAFCDSRNYAEDIAKGATGEGLTVNVNDKPYTE